MPLQPPEIVYSNLSIISNQRHPPVQQNRIMQPPNHNIYPMHGPPSSAHSTSKNLSTQSDSATTHPILSPPVKTIKHSVQPLSSFLIPHSSLPPHNTHLKTKKISHHAPIATKKTKKRKNIHHPYILSFRFSYVRLRQKKLYPALSYRDSTRHDTTRGYTDRFRVLLIVCFSVFRYVMGHLG